MTSRSLGHFENTFAKQIGRRYTSARPGAPKVSVVRLFDLELDIDVVTEPWTHRLDTYDPADGQTHQHDGVTLFQPGGRLRIGIEGSFDLKPAPALRGIIDVVTETQCEQHGGQNHEPSDGSLDPAQTSAELRS